MIRFPALLVLATLLTLTHNDLPGGLPPAAGGRGGRAGQSGERSGNARPVRTGRVEHRSALASGTPRQPDLQRAPATATQRHADPRRTRAGGALRQPDSQRPPKPRARALGVPENGETGPLNAITDVAGVEVGMVTLIRGSGRMTVGQGPVRTGVTAILPRGKNSGAPAFAGWSTLNGNGEMTGTTWVEESGFLTTPVMITNTLSVGAVHAGTIAWATQHHPDYDWALPVVAETWDGGLNDIAGQHVTPAHAMAAIDSARGGPVAEGNVGGGTGMVCHEFKGGTGTSSRKIRVEGRDYTLGVLVQCNYGRRPRFEVAGVPVGREIPDLLPCTVAQADGSHAAAGRPADPCEGGGGESQEEKGSIIVVIATDAPLLPGQLKRVAKRAALGIGRMGGIGGDSSGDIFIAFSTANPGAGVAPAAGTGAAGARTEPGPSHAEFIRNDDINPVFEAAVDATSEAILNAMLAAETMTGADGYKVFALPHDRLVAALRKYGRYQKPE